MKKMSVMVIDLFPANFQTDLLLERLFQGGKSDNIAERIIEVKPEEPKTTKQKVSIYT